MKYIFDSSSIFKAIKENRIELLTEGCTLELARYEVANIIWKEQNLHKKINSEEAKTLLKTIKNILDKIETLKIECKEEQILETANTTKITFYDAAYAYIAKEKNLILVTEDEALKNKISSNIRTAKIENLTE